MNSFFYVRRLRYKHGSETYAMAHAANNRGILCGRGDIDDGHWYIDFSPPEHGVTCPDCKREMKKYAEVAV